MPSAAVARIEEMLEAHAPVIGRDFVGYRNHAYRVAWFCLTLLDGRAEEAEADAAEKVAIAAALHDIGIWTAGTFDYLEPSVQTATAYLERACRTSWAPEITAMIREHHKVTPFRDRADWLVEPFRKADWVDVSRGLIPHGLPRRLVREVLATWPNAGFHRRLVQLSLGRLCTHPRRPLPMMRL